MAWAFAADEGQLRDARAAAAPSAHPREDWEFVDDDEAIVVLLAATRDVLEAGRGGGDWSRHSSPLVTAYNAVATSLLRQEDRLHDGETDLPKLGEKGIAAFMQWTVIVEQMRMAP